MTIKNDLQLPKGFFIDHCPDELLLASSSSKDLIFSLLVSEKEHFGSSECIELAELLRREFPNQKENIEKLLILL